MSRLYLAGLGVLLVLGTCGCRRRAVPEGRGPSADGHLAVKAVAGPTFVEIRGPYSAFAGLPAVKGILIDDHGQHQLADGTWSVNAYLSSPDLVDTIRSRGLTVKVLQTADELARQSEEIARELKASDKLDTGQKPDSGNLRRP
jgi:hypothetical protein